MNNFEITDEMLRKSLENIEQVLLSEIPNEENIEYTFSKKFNKRMEKLIRKEKKNTSLKKSYKYSRKIAISFIVIIIALFTITMNVDALRNQFLNVIKYVYERFTTYEFSISENTNLGKFEKLKPYYVPTGFKEVDRVEISDELFIFYNNYDGDEIVFNYSKLSDMTMKVDTENAELEKTLVNSIEADYIAKEGSYSLIWKDNKYIYYVTLNCSDATKILDKKSTIVKIAESIKK
ncbi:Uncharacterised protein [Clostridioides difficile]|nr:Uncharacterised protein [Clostridioides difficile]